MPVPAFRNSRSRVRRRRSHHALKPVNVVIDKETGEPRLPHRTAPSKTAKPKSKDKLAKAVVNEMKKKEAADQEVSNNETEKKESAA